MSDFNVRSDSIDVEQIMEQIRARIREKRGVDYTEQQLKELAAVKLEKFLDPRGVRSDLLERFKRREPVTLEPAILPSYSFEDETIYETHRGLLRFIRRLLNPLLKLFFNPNAIIHTLHRQADINRLMAEREHAREEHRREADTLYFEVVHNLVVEMTRSAIEVKNLKMRVESLASRLEFSERRARALESVVAYKVNADDTPEPESRAPRAEPIQTQAPPPSPSSVAPTEAASLSSPAPAGATPEGPGQRSRRRRRRRGRRSTVPATAVMGESTDQPDSSSPSGGDAEQDDDSADEPHESEPSAQAEPMLPAESSEPSGSDPDSQ